MRVAAALLATGVVLAACAGRERAAPVQAPAELGWRQVATRADAQRIYSWREAFSRGLAAARASGAGPKLDAEGSLLRPDAALPAPTPPEGRYRCRVTKLGSQAADALAYVAYPQFDCSVSSDAGRLRFVKLTGSQRPVGVLYPDTPTRMIFLGSLLLGDETMAMTYGRDAARDLAGAVERVGPQRWRIVFPYPRFESLVDVIELVPA